MQHVDHIYTCPYIINTIIIAYQNAAYTRYYAVWALFFFSITMYVYFD